MWKVIHFFKYSLTAAVTSIFCCIAPVILFQAGLMSGIYAISFADFFYNEDGSVGIGAIILRALGFIILIYGIIKFNQKENCSLNTIKQKRINKLIFSFIISIITISFFWSMDEFSSYYFDKHIVPQQQLEFKN
jgi:uncharacterized membrane protein